MVDYAFGISLPHPFDGKGVVMIPSRGKHLHATIRHHEMGLCSHNYPLNPYSSSRSVAH